MMVKKLFVSLFLTVVAISSATSVLAARLNFSPTANNCGTISVKMPIERLGSVKLPRGRLTIKDTNVEITVVPEWMFDRQVVLSGTVLRTVSTVTDGKATVIGIAYFQSGPWLNYIDDPRRPDVLVTSSGTVTGHILSADADSITFDRDGVQEIIPITNLRDIRSPRAYTFTIPATLANSVAPGAAYEAETSVAILRPISGSYKLRSLKAQLAKEDGDWSTGKIVLLGSAYGALELAQLAIPLVYSLEMNHLKYVSLARQRNAITEQMLFPAPPIPFTNFNTLPPGGYR